MKTVMFVTAALLAAPALAQDAPAAPALPKCTAKVQDRCDQTLTSEKRAMSGEQADARDARNGGKWTPDGKTAKAAPKPN